MITKIEIYTVNSLLEDLQKLVAQGLGDRVVLIPNRSEDVDEDYRFLNRGESFIFNDSDNKCVYLADFMDEIESSLANINFGY